MKSFPITVTTPSGPAYEGEIVSFSARGPEGDFAILADHVPFVTYVTDGECRITVPDGTLRRATTRGGLLTVSKDGVRFLPAAFAWKEDS